MATVSIDLNADLGESYGIWHLGDDRAMLSIVTSANIACGFHAGDPLTLRRTCELAVEHGVRIGAQVSYPDMAGFGRRFIDMAPDDLAACVIYQIGALAGMAASVGGVVEYVKPHGALYNTIFDNETQAAAVVRGVAESGEELALMTLPSGCAYALARARGMTTISESFADRAYRPDGSLVARSIDGSVITDSAVIAARAVGMATAGTVTALSGEVVAVQPESLCLHGDTPGAVEHAQAVRAALVNAGVRISSTRE